MTDTHSDKNTGGKSRQKSKVKIQIMTIFLLSVIVPVWLFGTFAIVRVRRQLLSHYSEQVHAESMRVNSILFDTTVSMYNSLDTTINNRSFMKLLGMTKVNDDTIKQYETLNETLTTIHYNTAAIASLTIYTDNPYAENSSHVKYTKDFSDQYWYQHLPANGRQGWILICKQNSVFKYDYYEMCLVRRMGILSDNHAAYIVLCIDNNYLKNRIEQTDSKVVAAMSDTTICYASDQSLMSTKMYMPDDFQGGYYSYTGPTIQNGEKILTDIATFQTYQTNDKCYISVSDPSAYSNIEKTTRMYFIILVIASLIPSIVIIRFSSYFSSRVMTLRLAMHKASQEDYSIIDNFPGDDELAETFIDLKTTIRGIQKKEALYYESKINEQQLANRQQQLINRQQQMEYNMLASQINPHFLYNTLETIRMQALAGGCKDVATSIKLLGKSMHYVLENTGTNETTLAKELDYIKTYLTIQKIRFGDRVNADFDIPEEYDLDSISILPLLLQPIVENAISHGLENIYVDGHIYIAVRIKDDILKITVRDNGVGMDADTLREVQDRMINHPDDARSIGLYNINQRIKLFYGEAYSLTIESAPGEGTTAVLTLPVKFT